MPSQSPSEQGWPRLPCPGQIPLLQQGACLEEVFSAFSRGCLLPDVFNAAVSSSQ